MTRTCRSRWSRGAKLALAEAVLGFSFAIVVLAFALTVGRHPALKRIVALGARDDLGHALLERTIRAGGQIHGSLAYTSRICGILL